jgi:hypothetical protein
MTRRGSILGLAASALIIATAGCVSNDQPSVHLVTAYQLRGPTSGAQDARSIDNLDGLGKFEISCELGDKTADINFRASSEDGDWLFALESSSAASKDKEDECTFTVREDNTYERECVIEKAKTVDCSDDDYNAPCRIAIVEQEGKMVKGLICCKALPIRGKQPKAGDYSIFKPGSGDKPAAFAVYNCDKQ